MALPLPKAFWPLTITAGVNDKIDVKRTSDSALFVATIAAGTYYSVATLARAVRDALQSAWANSWGVEVPGNNLAAFNPSFESAVAGGPSGGTAGWGQYNNSSGLEPFTFWGAATPWTTDSPVPHGSSHLKCVWAVDNTTTKGLFTHLGNALSDGTKAGIGWRHDDFFRVRFWARASGTNVGKSMGMNWNAQPNVQTALVNPPLSGQWQQYEFRVQWASNPLPGAALGTTGETYISIANSGSNGNLHIDKIEVVSEGTQTLSYDNAMGHFVIGGEAPFELLFSSGANQAVSARDLLGFGIGDTVSGKQVVSPFQHQNGWYVADPVQDDTGDLPLYERGQSVAQGGPGYSLDFGTRYQRIIRLGYVPAQKAFKAAEGVRRNEAIERLFDAGWKRVRWWSDSLDELSGADLMMDLETAKTLPRDRLSPGNPLYSLRMKFWKFVS